MSTHARRGERNESNVLHYVCIAWGMGGEWGFVGGVGMYIHMIEASVFSFMDGWMDGWMGLLGGFMGGESTWDWRRLDSALKDGKRDLCGEDLDGGEV